MKKLIVALLSSLMATVAVASSLSIVGGGTTVNFSGYNPAPNITGVYTTGKLGTLTALVGGTLSATYLGQESGYKNGFSFESDTFRLGSAMTASDSDFDDALNEYSGGGKTISTKVNAGVLDFWFRDNKSGYAANSAPSYKKASFAILAGKCIGGYGCFEYLLGFNDSYSGDADYDDFVVGLNLAPVPLPAALWLFGSALMGFVVVSNRRRV